VTAKFNIKWFSEFHFQGQVVVPGKGIVKSYRPDRFDVVVGNQFEVRFAQLVKRNGSPLVFYGLNDVFALCIIVDTFNLNIAKNEVGLAVVESIASFVQFALGNAPVNSFFDRIDVQEGRFNPRL
jgi:hypothetical protein